MKIGEIIGLYREITGTVGPKINPNAIINKTFPEKLSYALIRNVKAFEKEINEYNAERKRLCRELCEKDKEGRPVMINEGQAYSLSDDAKATLKTELDELLDAEVDIDIMTVTETTLEKCASSDRYHVPSNKDMMTLYFMITPD